MIAANTTNKVKYDKGLLMIPKNHQSENAPIGYKHQSHVHAVGLLDCINLFTSFKSALALEQKNKAIAKINKLFLENIATLKKAIRISIFGIFILAIHFKTYAKDFGTRGHTYKITEQAFLEMIDQRLQKVDMKKEQAKMTAIAKDRVENPPAVKNIKPATKGRVFYYDPTYTLDKDAVLPCGKILHKAGITVNPLQHMDLNRRIFFVDSREKTQVAWLKEQLTNPLADQSEPVEDRIILIGGSPFKLKEELGKAHENKVYFDQGGGLTTRFGITASPAFVVQDGLKLRIEEVLLNG